MKTLEDIKDELQEWFDNLPLDDCTQEDMRVLCNFVFNEKGRRNQIVCNRKMFKR